ncbi:MAG: hypothetical protein WD605_00535 [Candidatus Paceibacterota bacterium]
MKKFTYFGTTVTTLSVLVFAPILSNAQVQINSEADGFLNATTDLVATPTEAGVGVGANVEVEAETETSTNENDAETATETSAGISLRLNADGVAVIFPSQVNSEKDLEIFNHNTVILEENVDNIRSESTAEAKSKVEVVYKHQSRLLGLVPVTVKSKTVVVSGNGELEVESKLSWWGFLVTNKDRIENEIAARVRDNPTIMMSAEHQVSASAQAEIAGAIVTELNSYSSLQVTSNR